MTNENLFSRQLKVVNIGLENFYKDLKKQNVPICHLSWRPPAGGDKDVISFLKKYRDNKKALKNISASNKKALDILLSAEPIWIGVRKAIDVLENMDEKTILHSGPPISWERMSKLQQRGIIYGAIHENLGKDEGEVRKYIDQKQIMIGAANDFGVVGAGVGIVTPSMMLNVCENKMTGHRGYCPVWEGRSGLGTWGVYSEETKKKLNLIKSFIGPAIDKALKRKNGIALKSIIAKGLQMGDETHTRQVAEGLLLASEIIPELLEVDISRKSMDSSIKVLFETDRFFHSLGMASAMSILCSIKKIEFCTIITSMAGNGVEFGIKVSDSGEKWYKAKSPQIIGQYLSTKWGQEDAIPWLGESCLTEAVGLGGFAAAAAPVVTYLRGGLLSEAIKQTKRMNAICVGTNTNYPIPALNFLGPPIGIDIIKVIETGITPCLHGGIISKDGGHIGAGVANMPMECAKKAFCDIVKKYNWS